MWQAHLEEFQELLDHERGLEVGRDTRVSDKTSRKRKGMFSFLDDGDDDDPEDDIISVNNPRPFTPTGAFGKGPESDVDEEDEDTPLVNPGSFQFVQRKLEWEDRHQDLDDDALILSYKKSKDPEQLESIFFRNQDHLRYSDRQLQTFRLPTPATAGMVYNSFVHSLNRWDPSGGRNPRNWHKADALPNAKTRARTLGQFTKADRNRISKIEQTRQVQRDFEAEYSRFPTVEELAEASAGALKVKDVKKILLEDRGKMLGSKDLEADSNVDVQRATLRAVQRSQEYYSAKHRKMINAMWGLGGEEEIISNNKLAQKFGVTPQYMSTLKRKFLADIQDELRQMGV